MQINPYGSSTTILDAAGFFGRNDDLDYLFSEVLARRCVSVVGTRRIGKSSLLRCMCLPELQQRLQLLNDLQKYLLVYVDLGEFLSKTSEGFFDAISTQLIMQSRGRLTLEIPQEARGGDGFCDLLIQVQSQGFHLVLLLDAFHKVMRNSHFDPQFFSFMRAQANHGRVSYLTASIIPLDKCCHPYIEGSPFFNIFNVYRLGPLTEDEARQLIMEPALSVGCPFTTEEGEELRRLAGRHPFFIQRVAFSLFKAKYQNHAEHIKFKQEAYHDLLPQFRNVWERSLDTEQREYLREEARWKHVSQRRLPELAESALFRKFVRDMCNVHPVDITVDYLEEILNNLNNAKLLGESELTHLYLFSARTQNAPASQSLNEKGAIVRRILQDARDKLRPRVEQSDTAPEWQFFNILNYRYFRDRMKYEPLADLLGISVRQLHRERILAIEALRDALNEMEFAAREELDM